MGNRGKTDKGGSREIKVREVECSDVPSRFAHKYNDRQSSNKGFNSLHLRLHLILDT